VTESGNLDNYTQTRKTFANDTFTWTFTNTLGETEVPLHGRKTEGVDHLIRQDQIRCDEPGIIIGIIRH